MKSIINIFSGVFYTETESIRISGDGDVFTRMGDNYVTPSGDLIIKQGDHLFNTKTGINSHFGDPFLED